MIKKKWLFGGPAYLANQSNSKISDWLEKSRLSKKATFVFIMQTG